MSAESVHDQRPGQRRIEAADLQRLSAANGHSHTPRTVTALCEQFAPVCQSAVDPLEIASALEFEGLGDQAAKLRYGYRDVFALAQDMYFRVPRQPAEPEALPDPWQGSRLRPALHGLLYGLPGVFFPAAIGLLAGPGILITLIVALLVAWSTGQGLAYFGYTRLGRTMDMNEARRVMRFALVGGLAVVTVAMAVTGHLVHATGSVMLFGAGEGVYMLGAGVLMVLGTERWLLAALTPGVLGSAVFLALGRPPNLAHPTWALLAATPVLALLLALVFTRTPGQGIIQRPDSIEWIGALPAMAFGLVAAGLLTFPIAVGPHGHGGVNIGALLAALPLSLSMGAAEWSLLWYRRRTQRLLRETTQTRVFARKARLVLLAALLQYLAVAGVLVALTVVVAGAAGIVQLHLSYLPQLAAYGALGGAMFLALMLQAMGLRTFPLVASAVALAFEILARDLGVLAQIVACTELFVVLGIYAAVMLGRAVRHAY
jgi:hypothetical protein